MKDSRKKRGEKAKKAGMPGKRLRYGTLCLIVLFLAGWFIAGQVKEGEAADDGFRFRFNEELVALDAEEYQMRRSEVAVRIDPKTGTSIQKIKWQITENSNNIVDVSPDITVNPEVNSITLTAKKAGTIFVIADYTYKDASGATATGSLSIKVSVGYTIAEQVTGSSGIDNVATFNKITGDAASNSLILRPSATGYLDMIFNLEGVKWNSNDPTIVSLTNGDGYVSSYQGDASSRCPFVARGTGHTYIEATYLDGGIAKSDRIEVYVGPRITGDDMASELNEINMKRGVDQLFPGVDNGFSSPLTSAKVSWKVYSEDGKTEYPDFLSCVPGSSEYMMTYAKAGTYTGVFTTKGIEPSYGLVDRTDTRDVHNFLHRSTTIYVLAECADQEKNLQVGDTFDIAEAFNLSKETFNDIFTVDQIRDFVSHSGNGLITAESAGNVTFRVKLKEGKRSELERLMMGMGTTGSGMVQNEYKITIHVYDGYNMSNSEIKLFVGQNYQLRTTYAPSKGTETWKSADPSIADVDATGKVTAKKVGQVKITVTMKLSDGRSLSTSCLVTVYETSQKFELNPSELKLAIGNSGTVKAKFGGATSAKLEWLIEDPTVASVEKLSDDTVVITGLKAGTTMLTAINPDNYVAAYCYVTVMSYITSITLDTDLINGKIGQDGRQLKATYQPVDATANELEWKSSNTAVATVDEYGYVSFKGPGTTTITVEPKLNPNFIAPAKCTVNLVQSATSFSITDALTMEAGTSEQIKVLLAPNNSNATIKWMSTDPKVATVDSNGKVTAVAPGLVYIVATTENGLIDQCTVTVTRKASGITLSSYNIKVAVGESYTVTATPNPVDSTEKKFTWTVKDPSVATVTDGKVTGVSTGNTIITVKDKSGDVEYLYVSVYDKARGMSLNYTTRKIAKGSSFTLKPVFTPANVSDKTVKFTSSNEKVATVGAKGKVKGIKGGSCIITAVSNDGGYVATCLVTVVQPVTKVKLNKTSYTLGLGKTFKLKATVTSNSSSNKKVKWTSSNTKIATVSSSGKVKGKKVGTCTIKATATDGSKKYASCKVKVVRKATSISINKAVIKIIVDSSKTLKATVRPKNATTKSVKWTSSDSKIATVNSKGKVTGIAEGQCTVKATTKDGSKKTASCVVKVMEPIPISSIVVAGSDMTLIRGTKQKISYTCVPSNHTESVKFSSDNRAVATVNSSGVVYARRTGTATITIMTPGGKTALVQIRVIGLNKTSLTMEQYDTRTLTVEGANSPVSWDSSNEAIVTVSGGVVTAHKPGTAYIYARVNGVLLRCKVTVRRIS